MTTNSVPDCVEPTAAAQTEVVPVRSNCCAETAQKNSDANAEIRPASNPCSSDRDSNDDADSHADSDEWADWDDSNEPAAETPCPFCKVHASACRIFEHTARDHDLDLHAVRKQLELDFYGCMRLVNLIRKTPMTAKELIALPRDWLANDELLIPTLPDDPLLYAFEDEEEEFEETCEALNNISLTNSAPNVPAIALPAESHKAPISSDATLIQSLMAQLHLSESKLNQVTDAFREYKEEVRRTFLESKLAEKDTVPRAGNQTSADQNDPKEWEMDYYFGSYAETEIHETMLKDAVRTEAYRNFMYNNKLFFKNKVVLDVGCGTGILSMFAARAGAAKVIAVDNSTIINKARQIAATNGLGDKITFISGKIEEIILPVAQVDIIISEWMGYFLLFEGMLDSVLYARDRYLAPTGIMAPSHAIIKIAAIEDSEWYNDRLMFWNDVYGFNMEILKKGFLTDGQVDFVDAKSIISDSCTIASFDTNVVKPRDLDFESDFSLVIKQDATMHAICGWFDIEFRGTNINDHEITPETFSTGPDVKGTHWKQTMFVLDSPIQVHKDDVVRGNFIGSKSPENHRDMIVTITLQVPARGISVSAKSYQIR